MRIISGSDVRAITRLVSVDQARDPQVETTAAQILADVRRRGDVAVRSWSRKLDGTVPRELTRAELRAGWRATPRDVRSAIAAAIGRVRLVAEAQVPRPFVVDVEPGVRIEQRVAPLARVGCYVPGGRYPLPSTLIMTVVPAVAAGVPDITVVCPRPDATVLCAALEAGATRVLTIGGAQAIGALAYGTASIARVDKIVGPGNAWVAAAKSQVSRECPIDVHAGPSEIVVWSDTGDPEWIALDLLAQAEHDPDARAVFVTTRAPLARAVAEAVRRLMPADGPARTAITRHGAIVVARSRREAGDVVARLAPEHLVVDEGNDVPAAVAAGTVFVGDWSVQAAGDYATGSNHVLPTGGAARVRGGLSAADFVRTFTVQTLTRRGLETIAPSALALAGAEGLTMHAQSVAARLEKRRRVSFSTQKTPDVVSGGRARRPK
ncbi:MAG: histidinol dehydrogenase [Acidobacteria bacterium]|nr:histidinol dehydrogenase [Acidobacteriota bacterium]